MTSCPPKLRGDISKWLCEINTGVYVGRVSAKVRDALWDRICENIGDGQATMVYSFANEQHFEFRTHNTAWEIRDFDGIKLMMHSKRAQEIAVELSEGFSNASKRRIAGRRKSTNTEWVILDIETTGLNLEKDEIIEIAILIADEREIKSTWSVLIKTETIVPDLITELTGIKSEMLREGDMEIACALKYLAEIIKGRVVVCYNKKFDILFLEKAFKENGIICPIGKVIDVLSVARKRLTTINNYKLGTLAEFFKISCKKQHRAMADCEILYEVFLKLNEI